MSRSNGSQYGPASLTSRPPVRPGDANAWGPRRSPSCNVRALLMERGQQSVGLGRKPERVRLDHPAGLSVPAAQVEEQQRFARSGTAAFAMRLENEAAAVRCDDRLIGSPVLVVVEEREPFERTRSVEREPPDVERPREDHDRKVT